MKKIMAIAIAYLLVLGGLGAAAVTVEQGARYGSPSGAAAPRTAAVSFPPVTSALDEDGYLRLDCQGADYLLNPGKPLLPRVVQSFELPFGVRN
ncbi:MAG TPA: peptidase C25, partial [Thermoplasmatales archaeon]|nr:peptidase C25 [Thermoplasmatales archaeon]